MERIDKAYSIERRLLARVNANLSSRQWEKLHSAVDRVKIRRYAQSLLESEGIRPLVLYSVSGAAFPFVTFVQRIICYEIDLGHLAALPPLDSPLHMKISIDGRELRGQDNVALMISIDESTQSQSPDGVHTFVTANMKETALPDEGFWTELGVDIGIAELRHFTLPIGQQEVVVRPYLCGDWKALQYVIGCGHANSSNGSTLVCGYCNVDKDFLRSGWLAGSPFVQPAIDYTKSVRCLPSLPIQCTRYCAMHGVNRLLDNTLHIVQDHVVYTDKIDLISIVCECCPRWGEKKVALKPHQTRLFFAAGKDHRICDLLQNDLLPITVERRDGAREVITYATLGQRLLSACREYFTYSRIRPPTSAADDARLAVACDHMLACFHALRVKLAPTTHYLTSHFLTFSSIDRGAYTTLQEGAEHHHKTDRKTAAMVFSGLLQGAGMLEQLLNQQELHRLLRQRAPCLPHAM